MKVTQNLEFVFEVVKNIMGKGENGGYQLFLFFPFYFQKTPFSGVAPSGWLSSERVGLMTWWLRVRSPVETNFLCGVFSPLTSAEACEKSSRWLWKEKLC